MGQNSETQWENGEFVVTCDTDRFDLDVISEFLSDSYWASGIPKQLVEKSIRNSLGFAVLNGEQQVGFARIISDYATFAYLGDVFILPEFRGKGLSKWLMECIQSHSDLQDLRRWVLATSDAHGLYHQYGFTPLSRPDRFLEKHDPDVYRCKPE